MAWLRSHTVLRHHRKNIELAQDLQINPVYSMGHLHALWHAALEQKEDGDLESWSDAFIAFTAGFTGNATKFVRSLQKHGWLDGHLIHDWLDYAGPYLESRYRTGNPEKLKEIWAKHGIERGGVRQQSVYTGSLQSVYSQSFDSPDKIRLDKTRLDKKKNTAPEKGAERRAGFTPIQATMRAYKIAKGIAKDDAAWDKANFKVYARSAKKLLDGFKGEDKAGGTYLLGKAQEWADNFDWNLATIARKAWDDRGKHGITETITDGRTSRDMGHETPTLAAPSPLDRTGYPRAAPAGEIAKQAIQRSGSPHPQPGTDGKPEHEKWPKPFLEPEGS